MATETIDRTFVDSLLKEIVEPAADQLLDMPYFRDLRAGTLTKRRMQGFSLQHTWFNRSLLKGGALRMLRANGDEAFMDALMGVDAEVTHPDLCKKFGLSLGLTENDFATMIPLPEVIAHTSVIVAGPVIFSSPAVGKGGAMSDETIVQRYSLEMAKYLVEAPYNLSRWRSAPREDRPRQSVGTPDGRVEGQAQAGQVEGHLRALRLKSERPQCDGARR